MIHELKIYPEFFDDVISGKKLFEIRKFDRPFHVGDLLALNEFDPKNKCYTGNSCLVYIDYMLTDSEYCKSGYVVMSIKPCEVGKFVSPVNHNYKTDYSVPYATRGDKNDDV